MTSPAAVPIEEAAPAPTHLKYAVAEAALSFAGAAVAGTLWWAHRTSVILPCTSGGGCETVADSRWAHVTVGPYHDVPVALLGLIGYVALLVLSFLKMGAERPAAVRRLHALLWLVSAGGFGYSWYLQYVAHFLLQAFCVWCFTSACLMTVLFLTATLEGIAPWTRRR